MTAPLRQTWQQQTWQHRRVAGFLMRTDCTPIEVTRPAVEEALRDDDLLWLDLADTGDDTISLLTEVFHIHRLAVEDVQEFHQRPKVEDYDGFTHLVVYGAQGLDKPLVEVHCFYAEHFFVSVHREEVGSFADARRALNRIRMRPPRRIVALHRALDSLVDSMFPYLAAFDDRIDEVQDQIFVRPTEAQLQTLFDLRRQLVDARKLVTPQRDMMASVLARVVTFPGKTNETERYFRDLYDHLIRISDLVDSYRDLLSGSLDLYTSMVSNRLNDVTKQLTIIATVFLPLSFLTGFFGQNFAWLVNHIGSAWAFFGIGLGTEAIAIAILFAVARRRGWL
jgi:magnesium transporter